MAESLYKILALFLTVTSISHALQYSKFKNPTLTKSKLKGANLYPQSSETRQIVSLDGIWDFRKSSSNPEQGFQDGWYRRDLHKSGPVIQMPVPSSYNDVGENAELRDHVGVVWYDRRFFVPSHWQKGRVWLRFGSVHYAAQLFINGKPEGYHEIGHLPFEVEITKSVDFNKSNLLTVAVDNTLHADTIPQGLVKDTIVSYGHAESDQPFPFLPQKIDHSNDVVTQQQFYTFDFFNYAGIHRPVQLYYTPRTYIDDVIINTDKQGLTGFVIYNVTYKGPSSDVKCLIQLFNKLDEQIAAAQECAGLLVVSNAQFWWPYLMNPEPGYLYTLQVSLQDKKGALIDTYSQKVGIRTVTWSNSSIFVNDIPIYFRGFGMHEDSDLRGKGWDPVLWVKNFNLIKWVGANAFRTSHYPYAEEIYQMADSHGIMIIDECPSVDTDGFSNELLQKHMQSLTDLIRRDKNHASVVMWSISNEPRTANRLSGPYFNEVVKHVKSMDLSRPVTIAISQQYNIDNAAQYLDIISFNRYNAWYSETGRLSIVTKKVVDEAKHWHKTFKKPVLMSEYGADTMAGLHLEPNYVWSEEFQVALMSEHFKAFDELRQMKFFVGEFIWNFADFNTAQTFTRVGGNRKGIFTRQRQPKASAHHLQTRYLTLAATDAGGPAPAPVNYISDNLPLPREEL